MTDPTAVAKAVTDFYAQGSESFAASGLRFEWEPAEPVEPARPLRLLGEWFMTITTPIGHARAVRLMDVLGGRENLRGAAVCACHPLPFPAARDYRRRTRHRNRRRS